MNAIIDTFLKTLLIFASVTALPYYLIFYQDLNGLYTIAGSVVLCIFLTAVFLTPQRPAAQQPPNQPAPSSATSASTKPRSRLGYS
jgi:hypothetical protein